MKIKEKILLAITIMLFGIIFTTGCVAATSATASYEEYKASMKHFSVTPCSIDRIARCYILLDDETGVEYIYIETDNGISITPRLREE